MTATIKWGTALALISMTLSSCTLLDRQEKRINYTEDLQDIDILVTDAKQRGILVAPTVTDVNGKPVKNGESVAGTNTPSNIICAEPSPDVAQAISAAFTAAAQVDAKMNAAPAAGAAAGATQQISGSGSLGSSYAASIAQLGERLATVQLLRDKMYRACEGYQNGAITDTSYTLMLARFDKTMASMLASEVAGGAFGRGLAALGGAAGTGGVDPAKLKEAQANAQAATKKLKEAAAVVDDAQRPIQVEAAGKELDTAVTQLAALELMAAQTTASSTLASGLALGQIAGRTTGGDPAGVVAINRAFIDDDASSSLLDACIVALDRNRTGIASASLRQQFEESITAIGDAASRRAAAEAEEKRLVDTLESPNTLSADDRKDLESIIRSQQSERYQADQELTQAQARYAELAKLAGPSLTTTCDSIINSTGGVETIIDRLQKYKIDLREIDAKRAVAADEIAAKKLDLQLVAVTHCTEFTKDIVDPAARRTEFKSCYNLVNPPPAP